MNASVRFNSSVELAGKTATGIPVPDDVIAVLGTSRKPAVRVTVGGHTYRSTVAVRSGVFKVPLSAENREAAGVAAGDEIVVELALDTERREVSLPHDLARKLEADSGAMCFWEALTPSQKKWYVLPIDGATKPETRKRRVEKALQMLREGRKR